MYNTILSPAKRHKNLCIAIGFISPKKTPAWLQISGTQLLYVKPHHVFTQSLNIQINFFFNCTFFLCSIHCSFLHCSFVFMSYSTRVHGEVSNSLWASLQQILLVASIALSQFSAERSLEYQGGDNTLGTPLLVLKSENSALTDQTLMTNPLGTQQLKCKRDTQQRDSTRWEENAQRRLLVYI